MIAVAACLTTLPVVARAAGTFSLEAVQAPPPDCLPVQVDLTSSDPAAGLGFDFDISYNPAVADVTGVTLTSDTQDCLFSFNDPNDPNDPDFGSVMIAIACPEAITTSATLATITFDPVGNGLSALAFSGCSVNEVHCTTTQPGSVNVSCFPAPDNCPYVDNPGQEDRGGVGAGSGPDGIGDACQCGDVNGSGGVTQTDSVIVLRSKLVPPTATMAVPELCDVGGPIGCSQTDSVIILRSQLIPPTATVMQQCAPANPPAETLAPRAARRVVSAPPIVEFSRDHVAVGETAEVEIVVDPNGSALAAIVLTFAVPADGLEIVDVQAEPGVVESSDGVSSLFSLGATFATDRTQSFKLGTVTVTGGTVGATLQLRSQSYTFGDFSEFQADDAIAVVGVGDSRTSTPGATPAPSSTPEVACVADCDGDGQVTVDELTRLVDLALKGKEPEGCLAADRNRDGEITVDEIAAAISTALGGCAR